MHIVRLLISLCNRYLRIDGQAMPIWSAEHFDADPNVNEGLRCAYLTTGLICE